MKGPIKILHVFNRLDRGGAESLVMNLYRAIDRERFQFDFIVHTEKEGFFEEEIKDLGGSVFRIPAFTGNLFVYRAAWKTFFSLHPDFNILHSHVRSTASLYIPIAKKKGITTIIHSHSVSAGKGFLGIVKTVLQYPLRYMADYRMGCSYEANIWLFGKRKGKESIIFYNAIPSEKFLFSPIKREKIRTELGFSGELVIGHVGRFDAPKNQNFLIDIVYEIYKQQKNIKLLLVGDGCLKKQIEQQVRDYKLENTVIFTGVQENIPLLLQAMDVFLLPSLYEGLGIVLIEAQASGLPAVASTGVPKAAKVSDLLSFLSLAQSAKEWAKYILDLDLKRQPRAIDQVRKSGYDIMKQVLYLESFYEKILK